jgi:hypothetical protein
MHSASCYMKWRSFLIPRLAILSCYTESIAWHCSRRGRGSIVQARLSTLMTFVSKISENRYEYGGFKLFVMISPGSFCKCQYDDLSYP